MESESIEIAGRKIPTGDWDQTPESVKLVIEEYHAIVAGLTARVSALEERLNKNSKNSSIPPSKNGFGSSKKPEQPKNPKKATKKRIKQEKAEQKLYPPEDCKEIHEEKPCSCSECGEKLTGKDPEPHRHQIIEMPIVRPEVVEYRLHELDCEHCGAKTRAELPAGVTPKSYGEGLAAWIAILSSEYRQSYRQVEKLLAELCGIELSRGTIGRARAEINAAVASATVSAQEYVQQQPVVNVDETGFKQYNGDGQNPGKKRGWLWVVVTPLVSFFAVVLSRSQATAQAILGNYQGIVGSYRCPSYGWIENDHRQVCWAHLLRDFQAMAERSGASAEIGKSLLHKGHPSIPLVAQGERWHHVKRVVCRSYKIAPCCTHRGSEFVARMLTVSSSLKAQRRSVLDFLTQSCQAYRLGTTPPTLIPRAVLTHRNERIILL